MNTTGSTTRMVFACAFALLHAVYLSGAEAVTPQSIRTITFEQRLNNPLSLDVLLRDESGQPVRLANYFRKGPVIFTFGYYECPMLCNLVLNGVVEALQEIRPEAGPPPEVIFLSIDPSETPELAAAKKRIYLKRFGRPEAVNHWHFLVGTKETLDTLAREAGFRYQYDPANRQYLHPSGIVIVTPEGRISRYFFGVSYAARELDHALHAAAESGIGSPIQRFVMLCAHFMPLTGRYSAAVMTLVRTLGILSAAGLLLLILSRGNRASASPIAPGKGGSK